MTIEEFNSRNQNKFNLLGK